MKIVQIFEGNRSVRSSERDKMRITGMTKFKKMSGNDEISPDVLKPDFFTFCIKISYHRFKSSI